MGSAAVAVSPSHVSRLFIFFDQTSAVSQVQHLTCGAFRAGVSDLQAPCGIAPGSLFAEVTTSCLQREHDVSVGCDCGLQFQHYQKSPEQDVDSGVCFFCVCAHLSSTLPPPPPPSCFSLLAGPHREGMDLLCCRRPGP